MRWLEVRRHSLTKKGTARGRGSHLSSRGVALARLVGAQIGPIDYVVTSTSPRCTETALAMGFAVDDAIDIPSGYVPGEVEHHDQWRWPEPYVTYAELINRGAGLAATAQANKDIWIKTVRAVPLGGTALIITHGGTIEPTLVACFPTAAHESWDRR